jgi:anti-sigma factor RsiW
MNKPASWASREESLLLINAYLDKELDAAAVLDVERRIDADAALKAEYDRLVELKTALATHMGKDQASENLRQRVAAIAANPLPPIASQRPVSRRFDWRQMAAAMLASVIIGAGGTYFGLQRGTSSNEIEALVSGHERALLATAPFDIASSDRHTVKPWFDSKLALSPQVLDLSSDGFLLIGGRIDVIGGKPAPVMVYQRGKHVISVIAMPQPGARISEGSPTRMTEDGYAVLSWNGPDFRYSAVSDVVESDLQQFVSLWRQTAAR